MDTYNRRHHAEYSFNQCKVTKYFNSESRKVFSVCLFYVDKDKSFEKYKRERFFSESKIQTKFYAYMAGLIQSFDDTILNFPNYEIRLYTNAFFIEIYNELSKDNTMNPNLINLPYDSTKTVFEYIYSFMHAVLITYFNVNIHIYNCGLYTNKGLFSTIIRLFPFFEDLDEIHIRDTDSSFGNLADLYCINKWKSLGSMYYTVSSYSPDHIEKYIKEHNIVLNKPSVICNSIGGTSFLKSITNQNYQILINDMFTLCDSLQSASGSCGYGVDEIYVTIYCQKYITFEDLGIPISTKNSKYPTFIKYLHYDDTGANICYKNNIYEDFCNLFGYVTFIDNKIANNNSMSDTFLDNNPIVCMRIISYILFYEIKKYMIDDSYQFLKRVKPVINWLNRYYGFKINNQLLVYGLVYIMKKNYDSEYIFEQNEILDNNVEDFFYTSSIRIIYPNPNKYNDYFMIEYDQNISSNNIFPYQIGNPNYLTKLIIENELFIITKILKSFVFQAYFPSNNEMCVVKYIYEKNDSKIDFEMYNKIANIIKNNNLYAQYFIKYYPSFSNIRFRYRCADVYIYGNDNWYNNYYSVYNYIEGRPLSNSKILTYITSTIDSLYLHVKKLISTIQSLHLVGITHNDIHEDNIILTNDGNIALIDCDNMIIYEDKKYNIINYGYYSSYLTDNEKYIYTYLDDIKKDRIPRPINTIDFGNINKDNTSVDSSGKQTVKINGYEVYMENIKPIQSSVPMSIDYNDYKYLDYNYLFIVILNLFVKNHIKYANSDLYTKFINLFSNLLEKHINTDYMDNLLFDGTKYSTAHIYRTYKTKGMQYIQELFTNF